TNAGCYPFVLESWHTYLLVAFGCRSQHFILTGKRLIGRPLLALLVTSQHRNWSPESCGLRALEPRTRRAAFCHAACQHRARGEGRGGGAQRDSGSLCVTRAESRWLRDP